MGLRVTLDTTLLVDTPRGWDEADIISQRDKTIRGLFVNYTTDLEFWGDGFDYLDNIMNQDYCQTVAVLIETDDCNAGTWVEEFNGIIQLTQISKYDVQKRIISTKILDESFDAKIDNNKSLKAFVDVGTSKNGVDIQAASENDIQVFDPTSGFNTFNGTTREGYRAFDCFRFIIDYMTDGQVGFKSDVFSGEFYHWMVFNGKELRVGAGNGDQLEVSFKDLFIEFHKKCNLSFAIEPTPSGYTDAFQLRLEKTSYFEQDDALLTLDNVRDIIMNFNKEELFSDIEIGSKDFDDNIIFSYPPLNFKAFKIENYTILGQCNVDKTLNLVSKYIIDTNIIEDVVTNNNTKYDRKNFIIVTDGTKAIKYKEFDSPVSTGNDDGGVANRLTDSTADFNADGVVAGDMAVNMLTGLTANVNSVDAGGTFCVLDTDIFNNGDSYQVRTQPFNYNYPLTNIEVVSRFIGGLPNSVIKHISAGGTAGFHAGITTNIVDTVFPVTVNPIEYDDDSTAPFFDLGNNYDIVNFYYTIPSSGLYGFEARSALQLNGNMGADEVVNGDFAVSTGWFQGNASTISAGKFNIGASAFNAPQAFLKQLAFLTGNKYRLTFDCTIASGSIIVVNGGVFTSTGTYTVVFDYTNVASPPAYLEFKFLVGTNGNVNATIDNVVMKPMPRFDVTQTIQRISPQGNLLQSFSNSDSFVFDNQAFQQRLHFITQKTFPTFVNERVNVIITLSTPKGSNMQTEILTSYFDLVTETTQRTDFRLISSDDGGGDILPVDPDTFPIYQYKFEKAITYTDFKALKDAPEKAVLFSKNTVNHIFGWRNQIKYNRKTSTCEFRLRAKNKINGDC